MKSEEIRKRFLRFFERKGHTIVPGTSLIPENDSSVLFTTAGMQQFKPYYVGEADAMKNFDSLNTVSIQKSIRTSDIDEVGDETHLTFFEMLGNFSFGGYFKKEAIEYAYNFITKEMNLEIDYVSIFKGDENVPRDEESYEVWKKIGIPEEKIKKFGREDNFWGPTGNEGPCGPTTEIYVNGVEIWNIVFNEYYCRKDKSLDPLSQKGVDTGMGLERLAVMVQKKKNVFETDLFDELIEATGKIADDTKSQRIIADHVRSAVFMIADGVEPSNTERGYILRRLIRRAVRYSAQSGAYSGAQGSVLSGVIDTVAETYKSEHSNIRTNVRMIQGVIEMEENAFRKTLEKGLKQFEKIADNDISAKDAFNLYQTYGFPVEMTMEIANERGVKVDENGFYKELERHQEVSKVGAEGKFKGGLAGHSDMEIKYHTATHLLNAALRSVLGDHVEQKGSNITPDRLRFDFSHSQKMTDEEKSKVKNLINEKIKESLPVTSEEMSPEEAKVHGALGVFGEKYGEKVKVYSIGDFSKEICGGPHVKNTSELGIFKIKKEESVSAGTRRIKAILE